MDGPEPNIVPDHPVRIERRPRHISHKGDRRGRSQNQKLRIEDRLNTPNTDAWRPAARSTWAAVEVRHMRSGSTSVAGAPYTPPGAGTAHIPAAALGLAHRPAAEEAEYSSVRQSAAAVQAAVEEAEPAHTRSACGAVRRGPGPAAAVRHPARQGRPSPSASAWSLLSVSAVVRGAAG